MESLTAHPDVEDANALAGWMASRGYTPKNAAGKARDAGALIRRARFDAGRDTKVQESLSMSGLGQIARVGVKSTPQVETSHFADCERVPAGGSPHPGACAAGDGGNSPKALTAGAINKELDALDKKSSSLNDRLLGAGRGHERPSETRKKSDPLALEFIKIHDRMRDLQLEIEARYGPSAPRRLPTHARGSYGPREKRESAVPDAHDLTTFTTFCEVGANKEACEVVVITEGMGNKQDANFYPREALQRSARVFEGVKCFLDHPSSSDERERPERSVREVCGWFSECRYAEVNGKGAIVARLNFTENRAGQDARDLVKSAVEYQRQYPQGDKVLVGFSINAQGPSRRSEVEGIPCNRVESIDSAMSADLVTFPARGGRVLAMREAEAKAASVRWRREFVARLEAA